MWGEYHGPCLLSLPVMSCICFVADVAADAMAAVAVECEPGEPILVLAVPAAALGLCAGLRMR